MLSATLRRWTQHKRRVTVYSDVLSLTAHAQRTLYYLSHHYITTIYMCIYIYIYMPPSHPGVPGEIKRSRDLRGGRWSWTLKFAQKRSWVGRWSWAEQDGHLLLRVVQVVRQQQCNGHCLSDSVQHSSWNSNCAVHKSLGNGEGTPP